MSVVLSSASRLKAEVRLGQAISEFEKDLSAEQKAALCRTRDSSTKIPPDYHDVMRLTEEIDRNASRMLKSRRCFGTRFTNILHAVQQFAALGDVVVGGSQNFIACGVWSLVRMTLLTVVNFSSYLEKLSALLMNVGRSAPRYELLHQLYPRSKPLRSHLSEYFIVIVRICHRLLKMTKKSTFGQLLTFPSDADLKAHESELEGISSLIKEEVTLLMGQEVREQNSRIRTIQLSAEADAHRQRQDTYIRVLNACSTYNYEATWKETRKLGTTSWFQKATEYQEWRSSADSATLVCTGKLGSGKSVMLANIVGDLNIDDQTSYCPVAYFFCRHDICDSLLSSTVIRSLGRQLLRSIPDLSSVDKSFKKNAPVLDSCHILGVLHAFPRTFQAYFVLDGLDECNDQQRRELMKELRQLQGVFNLRICVACRSDAGNLPTLMLESFAKSSLMALPEENPEIKSFIDTELYNCIESGKLVLGDPQLSLEIADALLAGAQGMFLWVALQMEALCAEKTDEAIRSALTGLPSTLHETFSRIIDKSGKQQAGRHYQKRTFELVIAALRPLTTDELREALSVTPGDDVWNPARHLNDVFSALASCGSLIMVEEEDLTVRLIHHSVKQFLLSGDPSITGGVTPFDNAYKVMRATVLTYLNYGVFETQLATTAAAPSIPAQEAPYKIIRSMATPSTSRNIALKLLKARGQPSVDIGKVVSETMKHNHKPTHNAFKFHPYAKSFWLQHAWLVSEDETLTYTMLLKVISRVLGSTTTPDNERTRILFWAAEFGHPRILHLCFEHGLDIENRDNWMRATPLFYAAGGGHHMAVKTLAEHGANLDAVDVNSRTALSYAAGSGQILVLETLLDCGANLETSDGSGQTPLSYAAERGIEAAVTRLVERGADVGAGDGGSSPPLMLAVHNKHAGVVKILLEKSAGAEKKLQADAMSTAIRNRDLPMVKTLLEHGVDPNIVTGADNMTALRGAIAADDLQMVQLFLTHGADPNRRDDYGRTPLAGVAALGLPIKYEAIIKLLLGKGAGLDIKDNEGKTALWYAAFHGEGECVKTLVQHGADRDVMATDGSTAFYVSSRAKGHIARVKILLDNGFNVNLKDGQGRTPLFYAADCDDAELAKFLLEHGADYEIEDNDGLAPLEIASYEGVERLLRGRRSRVLSAWPPSENESNMAEAIEGIDDLDTWEEFQFLTCEERQDLLASQRSGQSFVLIETKREPWAF